MSKSCSLHQFFICPLLVKKTTTSSNYPVPDENTHTGNHSKAGDGISESMQTCPFRYSLCFHHAHANAIRTARAKLSNNIPV
ncbi:MAG TPA: hypothetical protein PKN48_11585 [Bacteroidales bacterium]|nr:hypothetical protein [Bacteroidales bacterium]